MESHGTVPRLLVPAVEAPGGTVRVCLYHRGGRGPAANFSGNPGRRDGPRPRHPDDRVSGHGRHRREVPDLRAAPRGSPRIAPIGSGTSFMFLSPKPEMKEVLIVPNGRDPMDWVRDRWPQSRI